MTELPDDVLWARALLSRVAEPGSIPVWEWVRKHGPVTAAARICAGEVPPEVSSATEARRHSVDPGGDLDAAERHDIRLVTPESQDWPHFAFAALEHAASARLRAYRMGDRRRRDSGEPVPPLALWVRGSAELTTLGTRSVALVGSRAATSYGEHVSADMAFALARKDVGIVSGGAYGIDAVAHRAALAAGGLTVIVSAGGLDRPYPPGNAALYSRVAESGLVISESPPGAAPQRHRFLTRNRLIAALSSATVVVEAARRSGARNTAAHARLLGRPVCAVPGPVTSPMSAGCHDLLRSVDAQTHLVTNAEDVLAILGGELDQAPMGETHDPRDELDPVARMVLDGFPPRRWTSPETVAMRCGVTVPEVLQSLPALDLGGFVDVSDAGYRLSARGRTSPRAPT